MKFSIDRLLTCWNSGTRALIRGAVAALALGVATLAFGETLSDSALLQIQGLRAEKEARTPAQQKMDSQLIYALKQSLNQAIAAGITNLRLSVQKETDGRVWVDLKAVITPDLLNYIQSNGGTVLNSSAQFQGARVLVPLPLTEALAGRSDVKFVQSAIPSLTRIGSVDSEGDTTHRAAQARSAFGVTGSGVKVGVLSDSVDYLAQAQATGDLPSDVTVLPGQSGVPGSGEGTAMLEIVYDLAPGAKLFFATADGGPAVFAQNILNLRAAGCDIIIDDVGYFNESPFQDGIIAQAVNSVTTGGALYFSAAGNEGNLKDGTSGTWEGDFVDGGAAGAPVNGKGGNLHSFGANPYDTANQPGFAVILLWSDPLGASTNDYDLYVLDSTGANVVSSSTTVQNGSQDPFEIVPPAQPGERVVVVKASGDPRFLHIDTIRGQLAVNTDGNITGHAAATNAYAVAAVDVHTAYPNFFTGGAANPVEFFSTDGPRRVFYNADGSPITPGNFLAAGGYVRQKPDITAADGVSTTLPPFSGLNPFYGTSAAAPHAGAIAALVKSYNAFLTPAQIRSILTGTALDIEAPGVDENSGHGIVMAYQALQATPPPVPVPNLTILTNTIFGGNGNGIIDYDECNSLNLVLNNSGRLGATGVRATLSTTTPGVIISQPASAYPDIPVGVSATNLTPFSISTSPSFVCGLPIQLTLLVKCDQATFTNYLTLPTGITAAPIRFDSGLPVPIPDVSQTNSIIVVSNVNFALSKVTVSLFITHTYDSDLVLQLVSPDGTTNTLSQNRGASGHNYGLACSPDFDRTTFDDSAVTPIGSGAPPFLGFYLPEQPLAMFAGKSGTNVNGAWKLVVSDQVAYDVGTIQCWSLFLTPSLCTDGGGECPGADLAIGMTAQPQPAMQGGALTYTLSVTNRGPSSTKNVNVTQTLPSSVVFVSASASQGSVSQAGGVVSANLGQMSAGGTATISVAVIPVLPGVLSSTATVASSDQPDFDPSNNSATLLVQVNPPTTDLAVGLSAFPATTFVGAPFAYTVWVTNNGPTLATGVIVTNVLPAGVSIRSETISQGSISASGNTVVCVFGTLASGAIASATVNAVPTVGGILVATANVIGAQFDPVAANNSATASIIVGPAADVALTLSAVPNPVVLGSNVTYLITVTNRGPSTATAVTVSQILPAGVIWVSTTATQGTNSLSGNVVTCNLDTLAANNGASIAVVVATTRIGVLNSSAAVTITETDPNPANNSATASVQVASPFVNIVPAGASLTVEGFSPPNGAVDIGETDTFQFRLQNVGNVVNTNLVATLQVSGGVTLPSGSQTYGILKPIGLPGGVPVSRPFTFTATGISGGTVVATLSLQDAGGFSTNVSFTFALPNTTNFANTNLILIPGPQFADGSGPASPYPSLLNVSNVAGQVSKVTATVAGLSHSYLHDVNVLLVNPTGVKTLLMSHVASQFAADNLTVTFDDTAAAPLPSQGDFLSGIWQPTAYDPAVVFSNPAPVGPYSGLLSDFNGVNPNGAWSLFVLDDFTGDTGAISNGWSLAFTTVTPVNQLADLGLSLVSSPNPVTIGAYLTNVFSISNAGPSTATGVTFSNALPATVKLISATPSQGNCIVNGGAVIGNLSSLAVGASATVTVVIQPSADVVPAGVVSSLLTNAATVAAYETDLHTGDNRASFVSTVSALPADVALSLAAVPANVVVSSNFTYAITVTNNGPGSALNVVVTNLFLSTNTAYRGASASQGLVSTNAGVVTASLGNLDPGAAATVLIGVAVPTLGANTSTVSTASASVTIANADPNPTNNTATASAVVALPSVQLALVGASLSSESSSPPNGLVNPGETVTVQFRFQNLGNIPNTNLVVTLLASGGVTSPSGPQAYGALQPGAGPVSMPFTFTSGATNGGALVATLQLQDGANNLGTVTYTFAGLASYPNTNFITIPDHGIAAPYPSIVTVSNVSGYIGKVTVTLNGLAHSFPSDVNVLLVSPAGATVLLMSHAGGPYAISSDINLTFDDDALTVLPSNALLTSGAYQPARYGAPARFPATAPAAPYAAALSALFGASPNGTWSLYVLDDSAGDAGHIAAGWSLNISTINPFNPVADLAVGMSSAPASVYLGGTVTYTINVTNLGPGAASGVVVNDTLPLGVSVVSTNVIQGAISPTGGILSFNLGTLAAGATATVSIVGAPSLPGTLINAATVSGNVTDFNPLNNSASASTTAITPVPATLTASITSGHLHLAVTGQSGASYVIQASTNLSSWVPISTNTADTTGAISFTDPSPLSYKARFYRAVRLLP